MKGSRKMNRQTALVLVSTIGMIVCTVCAYINFRLDCTGAAIFCTVAAIYNFIVGMIHIFWE